MRQAGIFFFFLGFICLLTQSGAAAESCFGPAAFKPYALLRSLQAARDCYEKVALDANNTIQNIQSLLGTMRNYYAFYNYAVDAPDSTPANNPENWVIYNGTENGQVDLRLKEEELVAQVQQNGANLLTLLDLATVINSPRDMHISSVLSFLNNAVIQNYINIVDMEEFEQIKNGTSIPGRYLTLSLSDGVSSETEQVVKVIDTVDGVDALEYLKTFVSMAGLSINNIPSYKALGSRMQSFLQQAGLKNTAPIIAGFPSIGSAINNLPDSVQVEYSDGSSTVWQFLFYPGKDANGQEFVDYSVDELIAYANAEPENSPYTLFNDALLQFQGGYIGGASQYNTMLYGDIGILVFLRDFYATILALGGPEIPSDIFETVTEFVDATDKYIPTVPEPPIGATNGFYGWTFTVYSVMSRITGFKSIPMEYFEVPPTHYIPFWPDWAKAGFGTNQYNSTELAQIYTQVSKGV
ncbi:hypothetical protein PSENEW3n2_00001942 [Picochlorum sp. SENEW3]|nr:hypothetical protein PSENEW3n2_00001942 [Picochlorum sp. SENEW3]WPT14712.1 hypothetical protein PSENEW3_00001942 [Picochlorum sp. SENEW3]